MLTNTLSSKMFPFFKKIGHNQRQKNRKKQISSIKMISCRHLVKMFLMNSWQLKFYALSNFSYLNNSFSSSSLSFSPKFDMIFLNSLIEILLPEGLKIEFIASISSSSVYGSLYSLRFLLKKYAFISS